jgi:RNA polymerase sigma-19 factor, ECF subfamily
VDHNRIYKETELFALIAQGNEDAFRQLFHTYTPLLLPGVMKMVKDSEIAREIVQEVFLKLWMRKEQVGEMDNPAGWLFRVASNLAISNLRKTAAHLRWLEANPSKDFVADANADRLSIKELHLLLRQAIRALPPKRKLIFQLSREQGWSIDEIAKHLKLSKNTVKNQISIALKFIQSYIQSNYHVFLPLCYLSFIFF